MSTNKIETNFRLALFATKMVEPVQSAAKGGKIEVLCRLLPGQDKAWVKVVDALLEASQDWYLDSVDVHVCRRYIRKDGKLVYGVHISVEAKTAKALQTYLPALTDTVLVKFASSVIVSATPQNVANVTGVKTLTQQEVRAMTKAPPRPPGSGKGAIKPVSGQVHSIKTVEQRHDDKGKLIVVQEFPLPKYNQESNKLNKKGRGVTLTGG